MAKDTAIQPLTRSAEDYLKAIYALSMEAPASTSQIAERLELAPASVSGMVRRLTDQKLLEHQPYRGVVLTATGRRLALRVLRRHRVIEAYLVEFLGYRLDDVHEEADCLEHAASDALVERMATALGQPRFDPHGDPIPDQKGRLQEMSYIRLPDLSLGDTAELRRVNTSDAQRMRYLTQAGLVPGTKVRLVDCQPLDGPVTVQVSGGNRVLAREMADLLLCERPGEP
jgi:DtxR family transcriptional regulator, Mn-dependent transcriptional regulator